MCCDHVHENGSSAYISANKLGAGRGSHSRRRHRRRRCRLPDDFPCMEILYQEEKGAICRKRLAGRRGIHGEG